MILRMDRLLIDLPRPKSPSPNAAAAVQELLGGKYGEMRRGRFRPRSARQNAGGRPKGETR